MSDIPELVRLLEEWRDAGALGRVKVGIEATRTIQALPAERKRALAREVAARVAPQLLPAIDAEDGDLTGEQVSAVIDLLRRADREQLDDLVTAIRTGDVDGSIALLDDALDVVAPTVAVIDPEDEGAPDATGDVVASFDRAEAMLDDAMDDAIEALRDDDAMDEAAIEREVRAAAEAAALAKAARWRDSSADRPEIRVPVASMDFSFDPNESIPHAVEPAAVAMAPPPAPVAEAARVAPASSLGALDAVRAAPDGYRRRRAAVAAIADDALRAADLPALLALLERPMDRVWVAGAALDAGLLPDSDIAGLDIPPSAVSRLQRRAVLR